MLLKVLCWNIWIDGNFSQMQTFLRQAKADIEYATSNDLIRQLENTIDTSFQSFATH